MKILPLLLFTLSTSTFASQCKYLSKVQVKNAQDIIVESQANNSIFVIDRYCEACLDLYPKPIVVEDVGAKAHINKLTSSLLINKRIEDIAYLYVNGENLASKVGCKTVAVSKYID
jgi:hypothetical protein